MSLWEIMIITQCWWKWPGRCGGTRGNGRRSSGQGQVKVAPVGPCHPPTSVIKSFFHHAGGLLQQGMQQSLFVF